MTKPDTDFSGIWALAWRSVVYLPVVLATFLLLLCLIVALIFPPLIGAACLVYGFWWQGVTSFAFWLLIIWSWRHFHLRQFFESPPSLL